MFEKKAIHYRGLSVLNVEKDFWFASNFEHWNFPYNKVDLKKKMTIETIVLPLWFFKDIKYNLK
jgi:hypothetical protein